MEPTKVSTQVVGVEDEPIGNGVEARPLTSAVLQRVDLGNDGFRVHWRGDHVTLEEKESGKITALDSCHGQLHHAGQGMGNAAGREEDPSRFGEVEGELGKRISRNDGWAFGNVQGHAPYSLPVARP